MTGAGFVLAKVQTAARLIDAGNSTGAERLLAEVLAAEPEHPRAHALMALALYRRNRLADAIRQADIAIGLAPTAEALRFKTLALIGQKRCALAAEVAEAAVRADPQDAYAALVQGIALEGAQRMGQAEAAFRRAVELAPGSNSLRGSLGCFLLRRRDQAGARAVAATLDPGADDNSALLLRGQLALQDGRAQEARDFALWVLQHNATDAGALRLLTQVKASRSPVLGLWWRYSQFIATKPLWQRLAVFVPLMAFSLLVLKPLFLLLILYLRISRAMFARMVRQELKTVKLRKGF